MSKDDDLDAALSENNPLTDAILEAADDLEKGRPLQNSGAVFGAPDMQAAGLAPLADLPADEPQPEPVELEETVEAEPEEKRPSIWSRLAEASPYTVVLTIALSALLIGLLLMILEMNSLGWQIKADV